MSVISEGKVPKPNNRRQTEFHKSFWVLAEWKEYEMLVVSKPEKINIYHWECAFTTLLAIPLTEAVIISWENNELQP